MSSKCSLSRPACSFVAALALCASAPGAQTCDVPTLAPLVPDVTPVWGGETRAVVVWEVAGSKHILTGEDGGRIRLSTNGGLTWAYSATPGDYRGAVLDIFMQDDTKGFATGRDGWVLRTLDGGASWTYFGNQVMDPCQEPATLWSVRPITDTIVAVAGLWTLRVTTNGGGSWDELNVYQTNTGSSLTGLLDEKDFHFYRLAVFGGPGSFVGNVAAEWEVSETDHRGVVLYTDAGDPLANAGRNWWITLDDSSMPPKPSPPNQGAVMTEPWDLSYERGSTDPSTAVGYVVGGPGGNSAARWWKTMNGGKDWAIDGDTSVTMYGVAAEPGDTAMIVGYSGQYITRAAGGPWSAVNILDSSFDVPPNGTKFRGAILAVDSLNGDDFHIGGSFGVQRQTPDLGASWVTMSAYDDLDEKEWRVQDTFFHPQRPNLGYMVGQGERILFTANGGCTWDVRNSGTGPGHNAVDFRSLRNGVAVGGAAGIHFTVDGFNWNAAGLVGVVNPGSVQLRDVDLVGADEGWAVGHRGNAPVVLYSANDGATWTELNAPPIGNMRLQGVAAANASEILVVGFTRVVGAVTEAKAWTGALSGTTVAWTEVSPPHPDIADTEHGRKLLGVALRGSSLATATGYVVGNNGMVLEWDGSSLANVATVYELDASGVVTFRKLRTDLETVSFSPSGNVLLIGGQYDGDLDDADDKGWLLRLDSGVWDLVSSRTSKDIQGISLTSDTQGFLLGQAGNNGAKRLDECDGFANLELSGFLDLDPATADFDNGNLADSILLRYDAQAPLRPLQGLLEAPALQGKLVEK